jgi:photosystem II stability/assembly factor-like uncharacterized protein
MRPRNSSRDRFGRVALSIASALLCAFTFQTSTPTHLAPTREVRRDFPGGQSAWFLAGRRYPPASASVRALEKKPSAAEKLREAFAESNRMRATRAAFIQPSWNELGPRPQVGSNWGRVSGRVTNLAIDPNDKTGNTLYVGTAFGGIWLCSNALSDEPSCTPQSDDRVSLSIGSVAVISQNGVTVVYIGTGEPNNSADSYYGEGIMRSPDGGKTWEDAVFQDKDGNDFSGASVSKIMVDPDDPKMMFAAVTSANLADGRNVTLGLFESPDAGKSWSLALSDGGISDIIYDPTTKTYYAAVVGKGIYKRAIDHQWKRVPSPFQCTSAITDTNFSRASLATRDGVVWALISDNRGELSQPSENDFGLVESRDGGNHWDPIRPPDGLFHGQGFYDQYVAAPPNSSELIVAGIDVWSTNNTRGTTTEWSNLTDALYSGIVHPDQHAIAFVDRQHWYVGNDGGLWSTKNAGGNWTNLNSTIGAIQFVSVTPDPNLSGGYFGGSQDNDTAHSLPATSTRWASSLDGDGGYTAIDDKHRLYFAEKNNVSLFYSDSSSGQWKPVVDGRSINERQAFYIPYDIFNGVEPQVALGTFRVWVGPAAPACAGAGWRPASGDLTLGEPGYITALTVIPNSSTVLVVTSDSVVQRTEDILSPQPKWTKLSDENGLPTGRAYSSITVSPSDRETMYVGVMGFATGYKGSGTGHVFKRVKVKGKFTWINITGNLKDVPVNSILVDSARNNDVYIATDAGVWVTTDGGKETSTWIPYGDGLPHSAIMQLKISTQGKRLLVAATHGRGAWAVPPIH